MIISKAYLLTKLDIWFPKYHTPSGEPEVWISQYKAVHSSGVILINFTKAKHLVGQRYCVRRDDVVRSPVGTNGRIAVYRVPFAKLEAWETQEEVYAIANNLWEN